jgi:hypothetical protein
MSAERNLPPARPTRSGAAVAAFFVAFILAAAAFAAGWFLGARKTVLVSNAPTHDGVAFVFEARCAEGICQSLRVGSDMGNARVVETLSASEQASEIAWTADGGRVAFIINGYQLRLFDARTGQNLGAMAIIDPDGFPPSRVARGVTFSSNGTAITFDDCPRDHSGCKPGLVAIKR